MPHPLEQRIAGLRTRVRRLVAMHGASWTVTAAVGAAVVLGLTDYLVRFRDPGLRVICSMLLFGLLGWTCYRWLHLPLSFKLRDVDLAARLQRRFPGLKDRLVSSVEFLGQGEEDPIAGSPALRRAVISQTAAETERLDFFDVLDRRPPIRAAMATAIVCLAAIILIALDPLSSKIALARLLNPLSNRAWPQKNYLMLWLSV